PTYPFAAFIVFLCRRRVFGPPFARGMLFSFGAQQPYGSRRLIDFSSALSTSVPRRRCRFCLLVLFVRMWRRKPLWRFTFPFAVILKRFAAPRRVFILGMWDRSFLYFDTSIIDMCRPSRRADCSMTAMS